MKRVIFLLLIAVIVAFFATIIFFLPWIKILYSVMFSPLPEVTNFLVLGLDKDIQGTRRTDVIIFANVNLKDGLIKISNIPRDLIVDGRKINSYYQTEGLEKLENLIEKFTGQKIDKYAIVDYDVIKYLGDSLGPVEIYVEEPMKYQDYSQNLFIDFDPGLHYLNGEQLLAYLRFRKDSKGDIGRIEREKYVIEQLAKAAFKKNIFEIANVYKNVYEMIDTNIKTSELVYLASRFRKSLNIISVSFPLQYDSKGNIYPGKLEEYKKKFLKISNEQSEKTYRFYILNNTNNQTRTYNVNLYYMWHAAGFEPLGIFDLDKVKFEEDTVFILNEKIDVKSVREIVSVVHPKRNFRIKLAKEDLEKYYLLVHTLSSERKYFEFPIDFIVILTD
ncbi:MAG: polyisoprenyl-teichoic acid--peptidoglycan teichoic acid transferase [Thermosipho sp. (in: thermotogales)]|nr:polyisoprenyl-teichoic acid--peptidoglycan teichoic acid transferase [Thermosipho sp. (in: thermotogales)]MDN5324677.1 polyisoprenyl-teichoic acid--peptidoglycan teichoic acid transferase [Thermosipho sp. (in: thermotogales)]